MNYQEYRKLCREVARHDKLYYSDHKPQISDIEYDKLYKTLEELERKHPEWVFAASPTQRVGEAITSGFKQKKHSSAMLSLANTYSRKELKEFVERIERLLGEVRPPFCCELKMDGLAISLRYEKGLFTQALTRGDGDEGDDVTANVRTIASLPLELEGDYPDLLELRGEVYMPHEVFSRLNEERKKEGLALWANPRNAAAGSLKLLDPRMTQKRELSIVLYGSAEPAPCATQHELHELLQRWGLPTVKMRALCYSLEEIELFANEVEQARALLPFDIDGIVVKVDQLAAHDLLGSTGKAPRWAVAFKFSAAQVNTRLLDITVQVGRSGVITPVAELEPVRLSGSTIARATLHNVEEIERKDIRIGDLVSIEKGGDVIPKVSGVDLTARTDEQKPWLMPSECPSCGTKLIRIEGEVAYRCPNKRQCPAQMLQKLIYFASKKAMNIDTIGKKVVEQLVEKGFVQTFADFYRLDREKLSQLEGFKDKAIDNALSALERSKSPSLPRFLMALGISHVGEGTAELIAQRAPTLEQVRSLAFEDLFAIDGIGEKVARSVTSFFSDPVKGFEVDELVQLGVCPERYENSAATGHPFFTGKSFVLTGTLSSMTREAAALEIKKRGGKVVSSISAKTDYLVKGEEAGSKYDKALKLGVAVIDEEMLCSMLKLR